MADWPSLRQAGNFYRVLHCAPGFGIAATGLGKRRFDNAHEWILTTRPTSKFHRMQVLYHIGVKRFFKKLSEGFTREPQRWPNAVRSILPESARLRILIGMIGNPWKENGKARSTERKGLRGPSLPCEPSPAHHQTKNKVIKTRDPPEH